MNLKSPLLPLLAVVPACAPRAVVPAQAQQPVLQSTETVAQQNYPSDPPTSQAESSRFEAKRPPLKGRYKVTIVAADKELAELDEIAEASLSILQSPNFRGNLLSLKNASNRIVSAVGKSAPEYATYEELADVVSLASPKLHKFRSHYVLLGTYFSIGEVYVGTCKPTTQNPPPYVGDAGALRGACPVEPAIPCESYKNEENRANDFVATRIVTLGADSILESVIGRKVHERWRSESADRRSCAINTFTHELLHAFSKIATTGYHENHFVDTVNLNESPNSAGLPIATYLVGSVAQCTWLQDNGRLPRAPASLRACVERFGMDRFNSLECK